MKPDFQSAELLISRAELHLVEFDRLASQYTDSSPYVKFVDIDTDAGRQLFKAGISTQPPASLAAIAFDIFNALRSSLDHVVYDAAIRIGGKPRPQYTKFPFGKFKAGAIKDGKRKGSEVPIEIDRACLKFRPYRGGNRALWAMNEMRNGKIHRTLSAMASVNQRIQFSFSSIPGQDLDIGEMSLRRWDWRKKELTYLDIGAGQHFTGNHEITVLVAFGKRTPFSGKEAVGTLRECVEIAKEIVGSLKEETARILASRS